MPRKPEVPPSAEEASLYNEIVNAHDEVMALLGETRGVMKRAEETGERDHTAMEALTSRLETANRREADAVDRWLAHLKRQLQEE